MGKQERKKEAYVNKDIRMGSHNTLPTITEKGKIIIEVFIQLLNSVHWRASALFMHTGSLKPEIRTCTEAWSGTASLELSGTPVSRAEACTAHTVH